MSPTLLLIVLLALTLGFLILAGEQRHMQTKKVKVVARILEAKKKQTKN